MDDHRPQQSLLLELQTFAHSLRQFNSVSDGLSVDAWREGPALKAGRQTVERLLLAYGKAIRAESYYADARLFKQVESARDLFKPALDAIWMFSAILISGVPTGTFDTRRALQLAFGGDPLSLAFRGVLLGAPWRVNPEAHESFRSLEVPVGDRVSSVQLASTESYLALETALVDLGRAGTTFQRAKPYPGIVIDGISPRAGCTGGTVHISGSGFGLKIPANAMVVFGSIRASAPERWTRAGFDVRVPKDVGDCCVSVLEKQPRQTPSLGSAATTVAAAVVRCFGATGTALANRLSKIAMHFSNPDSAFCSPDGSNRFVGGPPQVNYFRTGFGSSSPQRLLPGQPLQLEWSVANATSVTLTITPEGSNSPYSSPPTLPPGFVPSASGKVTIPGNSGLIPWKITVTLKASNPCGTTTKPIGIGYSSGPGLVFVGGGMRCAFHMGAIEALGAIGIPAPTVCAGSGLGALSAVASGADYPDFSRLRNFWNGSIDHDHWYLLDQALFVPGGDYQALDNAEWQAENRAEVLTLGALDLLRLFLVPMKPGDQRLADQIITTIASKTAGKAEDLLGQAVQKALESAGASALSEIPIVAIVYAAAEFAINAYLDSLKQETATQLATRPSVFLNLGQRALIGSTLAGVETPLGTSGCRIRIPLTTLEVAKARYASESGTICDPPGTTNVAATASLTSIVTASATVPLLSPPVKMGTDNYVDGCLRDPVPIGATIEAGADVVIVIQPNIRLMRQEAAMDTAGLPQIDARSSQIRDSQFLDSVVTPFGNFAPDATGAPVGSWRTPVYVIEPTIEIVGLGASYGQVGLVNIMADYGYMRAFDVIIPPILFPDPSDEANRDRMVSELSASTDNIIGLRVASWELEHQLNGWSATPLGPTPRIGGGPLVDYPDNNAIDPIRGLKTQIHDLLVERLAIPNNYIPLAHPGQIQPLGILPVPKPRAEQWYLGWEAYNFLQLVSPTTVMPSQPTGNPWVSLSYSDVWTVPAAAPPPTLWP